MLVLRGKESGHAARKPNDVVVKQLLFALCALHPPSRATLGAPTSHGWTTPA